MRNDVDYGGFVGIKRGLYGILRISRLMQIIVVKIVLTIGVKAGKVISYIRLDEASLDEGFLL